MKDDHIAIILADNLEAIEQGAMSLAECLARYPEHREEMVELLGLALAIRDLPPIVPRPGFRYTARSRLLRSVAARQQVKQRGRRERVFRFSFPNLLLRPALSLAILIVLLVVTLSAGTAYAAGSALPGDSLYPVKIAVEDARLMLSSEEGDASLYLQFADERLQEIDSLAAKGRYADISTATQRFEEQLQAASETMNTLPYNSTAQLENQAVHLNENLAYTKAFLETLQATQLLPDAAQFGIGQAIRASAKGQSKLHAMFPDKVPGPPESVSPGPPEEVGPSVDKPQGPQGVGPQKSPGPPEDKGQGQGQGQGQDKDKGKPDKSKEPSKNNSQGPPPDVTQGPPGDKDKPKDSPNNPSNNKPANGKP